MEKRILIIPSWYPNTKNYLVGSFFQEQALLLMQHGYDIRILFLPEKKEGLIQTVTKLIYRMISGNRFILDPHRKPITLNLIVDIFSNIPNKVRLYSKLYNYIKHYAVLKSDGWEPDVIHAQSTLEAGIIALFLSRKLNKPFVIIEHQVFLLNRLPLYKQRLVLQALMEAKKVGVVSEHQKKMVLMQQPNCDPTVIWNYVNEDLFKIKAKSSATKFTIITITYPAPIKDYKTFFLAMKEIKSKCDDFRFIIIGNNSFGDKAKANTNVFESLSRELDIYQFGTYIPFLGREEICSEFNESDVFVSTSIAETFGLAAREAMLCGLPVVTTACGGIEDSITPDTGITVPIRDYKQLAAAILRIKNKEKVYAPNDIHNFVIDQCGKEAFVKKMKTFYAI